MERRARQRREEYARRGAVPREYGPAGEFVRAEDTRGRSDFAVLADRASQEVQAVYEIVRRIPGVGVRKPFTLPARSEYICMCCNDATFK